MNWASQNHHKYTIDITACDTPPHTGHHWVRTRSRGHLSGRGSTSVICRLCYQNKRWWGWRRVETGEQWNAVDFHQSLHWVSLHITKSPQVHYKDYNVRHSPPHTIKLWQNCANICLVEEVTIWYVACVIKTSVEVKTREDRRTLKHYLYESLHRISLHIKPELIHYGYYGARHIYIYIYMYKYYYWVQTRSQEYVFSSWNTWIILFIV